MIRAPIDLQRQHRACTGLNQVLCVYTVTSSLMFLWNSWVANDCVSNNSCAFSWVLFLLLLCLAQPVCDSFILYYYNLFVIFLKSEWMNEQMNTWKVATRIKVNNWTITYTCWKKENQFSPIEWHWLINDSRSHLMIYCPNIIDSTVALFLSACLGGGCLVIVILSFIWLFFSFRFGFIFLGFLYFFLVLDFCF